MYLHHPHKMNKQTLRSRHFWESSQHWKNMKIPEHPGAQALKLTSTRGSGNLWTIWCSAWTIDCLWSSCFKSHASVAHVASRPFLLIDVDRTLYTLTTGPMAWVVLKINLDTFWWFCMSLHVQVLLFFLFELIVWILATGDPCRSVAGDVPSAEVNFHKLGCSGFFYSEVCLGLGPDGAKFGSINEWRLL